GFIRWRDKNRQVHTTSLSYLQELTDVTHAGLSTQFLSSEYSDPTGHKHSNQFGDTLLTLSHEAVSEYSYSAWKPKVYLTALLNLPTGRSVYESQLAEMTDVAGFNQYGTGVGVTAKKVWFPLTLLAQAKALHLFGKEFDD